MLSRKVLIVLLMSVLFPASVALAQSPACQILPADVGLHPAYWYIDGAGGALIANGATVDKEFDFPIPGDEADYEFAFWPAQENYLYPFTLEIWMNTGGWAKVTEYDKDDFLVSHSFVFDVPSSAVSQVRFRLIPEGACLTGYSCIVEIDHFKAVNKDCSVGEGYPTRTPTVGPTSTPTDTPVATNTPFGGCSDCWNTPTPTTTPGTPTPHYVPGGGVVESTPPPGVSLPGPGDFGKPTSIPAIALAPLPSPIYLAPISTPSPLTFPLFATPDYSTTMTYTTPISLDFSGGVTDTAAYTTVTGILESGSGWISNIVSYTNWLSNEVATLQQTGTFTIYTAPAWYAPDLPRSMANVGWTFEQLQSDIGSGERYSLSTWAWFAGYTVSLPFQLVKVLYQIVVFLGPLGLFMTWLLVMLPYKLWVKLLILIKNFFISLLNFAIRIIRLVLELINIFWPF